MSEYYDDVSTDYEVGNEETSFMRWMSAVIAFVAIVGFFALIWYAYNEGSMTMAEGEVEVITADTSPMKEIPEDPGGWKVPHQDKEVYNVISSTKEQSTRVETLLPEPEQPIEREKAEIQVENWEQQILAPEKAEPAAGGNIAPQESGGGAVAASLGEMKNKVKEQIAAKEEVKSEKPKEIEVAKTEAPSSAAVPTASEKIAVSKIKLQLGAYRSQSEATSMQEKLKSKHAGMLSGHETRVQRADLGDKGVFYRLQLYPFNSKSEATSLCGKLKAKNQDCFVVTN